MYFTNSAQRFFGRLAVEGKGNLAGPVHVIANRTGGVPDMVFDNIALDVDSAGGGGEVWIAAHPSQAVRVSLVDESQLLIDAARLLNSTSAAFGRGSARQARTLYVTNGGDPVGNGLVNGGVVAIDLSR